MKERPILFSTPMVQAILKGTKTQTRRVVKPQPEFVADGIPFKMSGTIPAKGGLPAQNVNTPIACPYGSIADVLWVREEHYRFGHWEHDNTKKRKSGRQAWKFVPDTDEIRYSDNPPSEYRKGRHHKDPSTPAWHRRLARFMPKAAARILLEITNVRVERLQQISAQDAIAEGIDYRYDEETGYSYKHYTKDKYGPSPVHSFQTLWHSINGEQSWNYNPWVWVVEFKRIKI